MFLRKKGCIAVTRPDFEIDYLLSKIRANQSLVSVSSYPYILGPKDGLMHLAYVPGFSSGFVDTCNTREIIHNLNEIVFDTAILMFLDVRALNEFKDLHLKDKSASQIKEIERAYVTLDLNEKSCDCILAGMEKGVRQKALSSGREYCVINTYSDDFHVLYNALSESKNFSDTYKFSESDFKLLSTMKDIFFVGIIFEDDLVAGSFFRILRRDGVARVDYLLSATHSAAGSIWSVKVLWEAIKLAKELNCVSFNFGGGVNDGDSLERFKLAFGGSKQSFYALRMLSPESSQFNRLIADNALNKSFFP